MLTMETPRVILMCIVCVGIGAVAGVAGCAFAEVIRDRYKESIHARRMERIERLGRHEE